ncbi:hypothetical protein MMC18_006082 [Xylographa bjoerkii]|nr:hypothetical protein [Xylographa bjoerkii]
MIIIAPAGDLTIKVVEEKKIVINGVQSVDHVTTEFLVHRRVLMDNSPHWKNMLFTSNFVERRQNVVSLEGDSALSMEIWFRLLHKVPAVSTYTAPLTEMWHLIYAADKYFLDFERLYTWFSFWYDRQDLDELDPRQLLYPCWRFDHVKGFAAVTKRLVYGSEGHITEWKPEDEEKLHIPPRLLQQLNAAKGRLRTLLHQELWRPGEKLIEAPCMCSKATFHDYHRSLYVIVIYPLETVLRKTSMAELLSRLDLFDYNAEHTACVRYCQQNFRTLIEHSQVYLGEYFDGLCLDCISSCKTKTGDKDWDYWKHHDLKQHEWVTGCRIPHKQPTWYYSFLGRPEDRNQFTKRLKSKKCYREDDEDW